MDKENANVVRREGTPPTDISKAKTETNTPEGQQPIVKTPIEQKLEKLEKEGKIPKAGEEQIVNEEKELTLDQEEVVQKHKEKQEEKQKKELEKKQKAYEMLQQGAYFMKFIYDDIERQKKEHLNRPQRRRFEKELRKGIFSRELVEVYAGKIDVSLQWIEQNINNLGQVKNKIKNHYETMGYSKPHFLKAILDDLFKVEFLLPDQKPKETESIDGEKYFKELKEKESK